MDLMFQNKARLREKSPENYASLHEYAFHLMVLELIDLSLLSLKCYLGYKTYMTDFLRQYV